MTKETTARLWRVGKWVSLVLFVLLAYIFQVTPNLLRFGTAKPIFLLPICVVIAILEGEVPGAIFGALSGLLWDVSAGRIAGFNGFYLALTCVVAALLFTYLLRKTVLNGLVVFIAIGVLQALYDVFFNFVIWGYDGAGILLLRYCLPSLALSIPLFFGTFFGLRKLLRWFDKKGEME